ncbi:MAG: tRNA pseudouridine(55) synthase TruB [bacterium]
MKGIIVVSKDKGVTSRDVVNSICKIFNTKKVGHTGTLDPMATGVLIICIGRYTKLVDYITSENKEYIAGVKLGITTDTLDTTGNILGTSNVGTTKSEVLTSLNYFTKKYEQQVPIYSAVKINGKKLYEYARNNEKVDLPVREVNILETELLSFSEDEFEFKTLVSKGTYIRSLIYDVCKNFNHDGVMSSLIRTKQGKVCLEESYTLDDIKQGNYKLLNARDILCYEEIIVTEDELFKVKNGTKINKNVKDGKYIIMNKEEEIAIYEFTDSIGRMSVLLKIENEI